MSVSLWQRGRSPRRLQCDVAVIGAGIAGLSAGLELVSRGLTVVVVERHEPGAGASGRNAGYLMRGAADNYAAACQEWGRDRARELWMMTEVNLTQLRNIGVESLASFTPRPSCLVAFDEREESELSESAKLLNEDGFSTSLVGVDADGDTFWRRARPRLGLINPDDAVVDPMELVRFLSDKLPEGVVCCNEEVCELEAARDEVFLRTSGLEIRAGRVMVCLNAYAATVLPELEELIKPNRGQMLALRPEGAARLDFAYYANHGSEYFREGPHGLILFGGARIHDEAEECTLVDEPSPRIQVRLEELARLWLCDRFEVVARWAGIMGFSCDHMPVVGEVRPGVWVCAGFTGHGMSLAHSTARAAAREMIGEGSTPFSLSRFSVM